MGAKFSKAVKLLTIFTLVVLFNNCGVGFKSLHFENQFASSVSPTPTPSNTATPTPLPSPSVSPTPRPSPTATAIPSPTPTPVPTSTPILSGSIVQACASLSSGQSADFPGGAQSEFSEADIHWQTAFYQDQVHGIIHMMGKPANADSAWHHQYYDINSNRWIVVATGMWRNPGHIYGNMTIDPTTGDVYQIRGGANNSDSDHYLRAGWWKFSTKTWGYTTTDVYNGSEGLVSHANGAAYHPNLYGPGDGALIWETAFRTIFWRKSNGAVINIAHGEDEFGNKEGVGEYWPSRDIALVGGATGFNLAAVVPNGGGKPIVQNLGRPPISLAGHSDSGSGGFGSLHVHPQDPSKVIIVERGGSRRVWTSTNGSTWTLRSSHPFSQSPYIVSSLENMGCLWAVGRKGNTQFSRLWRPAP